MLEHYGTSGRTSGITEFVLLPSAILLLFRNGAAYLYTADTPGSEQVETMRRLARQGRGLSTYVSRFIGNRYAQKLTPAEVAKVRLQVREELTHAPAEPASSRP